MITLKQVIRYPDTNSVEATWVDADGVQIKCHSYADVQMDMLETDLATDLPAHAALIATVRANIVPPPVPTLTEWKVTLKTRVDVKMDQVQYGGTVIGGIPVATDSISQAKLTGALNFTGRKPTRIISWKASNGQFVSLTKAQIEALSDGVGEFVAKCYDAAAAHYTAIDALATVSEYNINTGWPA